MGKESYLTFYKSLFSPQRLPWVIIAFGTFVRLVQYLYNRSLWNDEAALALNIVNRSYAELLQPLDYDQAAPIGFLYVEKFITQVLGNSEYSLRLFPFLSAIVSLFIFYQLAKQYLQPLAATIALALFASLHIQDGQGISDLEWQRYIQDLDQLKNYSRVWIVFSHVCSWAQESERITSYLNTFGKQTDAFQEKGSFVYLYTFTKS